MEKRIILETKQDEGNIFLFNLDSLSSVKYLSKTASAYHPEIADYIRTASPIEGKLQVLITALGALEYYGQNKNKDGFPESALKHEGTDYGFKTFETHAKVFKHHINKPNSPSYGNVRLSVWNDEMKRVELILIICRDKAPDIATRIDNGEYLDLSMGCHVPYDVCSICGNRARTKIEYCDHIKFYSGKIPPGHSKIAYMINTLPKFFDISFVTIGADSTAKVMKKIASFEEYSEDFNNFPSFQYGFKKEVPSNLEGNLVKAIFNVSPKLKQTEKRIPSEIIKRIVGSENVGMDEFSKIISSFLVLGILPHPDEFQEICLRTMGEHDVADDLISKGVCFDPNEKYENEIEIVNLVKNEMSIDPLNSCSKIINKLSPYVDSRSYALPVLRKRLIVLKNEDPPVIKENIIFVKHAASALVPLTVVGVGAAYKALQKLMNTNLIEKLNRFAISNPTIAFALGVGALIGINAVKNKITNRLIPKENLGDYVPTKPLNFDQYLDIYTPSINKTAGLGKRIFLGIPAVYMAAGLQEAKRYSDPYNDEGAVGKFVRENPLLISTAIVGEHYAGSPISKILKKPINFFSKEIKTGVDLLKKRADYSDCVDLEKLANETAVLTIMLSS